MVTEGSGKRIGICH